MTPAQLQALKSDLATNTNTVQINGVATAINAVPHGGQNAQTVADWYNQPVVPSFWVWQPVAALADVGKAIKMSDVGNLTTANSTRLQTSFQIRPGGFNPANQDDRSLFGGLFSVSGAVGTRASLLTAWQRLATNAEKLFATGTGTQVTGDLGSDGSVTGGSPAVLSFSGAINGQDVLNAWGP